MVSVKLTPQSLTRTFLLKSPLKQESFPRPKTNCRPFFSIFESLSLRCIRPAWIVASFVPFT